MRVRLTEIVRLPEPFADMVLGHERAGLPPRTR
jgi:hypothetical protein